MKRGRHRHTASAPAVSLTFTSPYANRVASQADPIHAQSLYPDTYHTPSSLACHWVQDVVRLPLPRDVLTSAVFAQRLQPLPFDTIP